MTDIRETTAGSYRDSKLLPIPKEENSKRNYSPSKMARASVSAAGQDKYSEARALYMITHGIPLPRTLYCRSCDYLASRDWVATRNRVRRYWKTCTVVLEDGVVPNCANNVCVRKRAEWVRGVPTKQLIEKEKKKEEKERRDAVGAVGGGEGRVTRAGKRRAEEAAEILPEASKSIVLKSGEPGAAATVESVGSRPPVPPSNDVRKRRKQLGPAGGGNTSSTASVGTKLSRNVRYQQAGSMAAGRSKTTSMLNAVATRQRTQAAIKDAMRVRGRRHWTPTGTPRATVIRDETSNMPNVENMLSGAAGSLVLTPESTISGDTPIHCPSTETSIQFQPHMTSRSVNWPLDTALLTLSTRIRDLESQVTLLRAENGTIPSLKARIAELEGIQCAGSTLQTAELSTDLAIWNLYLKTHSEEVDVLKAAVAGLEREKEEWKAAEKSVLLEDDRSVYEERSLREENEELKRRLEELETENKSHVEFIMEIQELSAIQ